MIIIVISSNSSVINRVFAPLFVISTLLLFIIFTSSSVVDGRNLFALDQITITNDQSTELYYSPDDGIESIKPALNQQQQTFIVGFIANAPYRACRPPKQMDKSGVCRDVWNHQNSSSSNTKQPTTNKPAIKAAGVLLISSSSDDDGNPSLLYLD